MALLRREPIVAVAAAMPEGRMEDARVTNQGWQTTAWNVWHDLGEIHYPTSQIARLVSRVMWIGEPDTNLDELFSPPGITEVSRLIALNLEVAGEGWLIQTDRNAKNRPIEMRWEVLAVHATALQARLDSAAVKVRFWNPDPSDPTQADSAVRGALGPASELLTLQALSRSQARNRLATAGLLLRPNTKKPMVDDSGEPIDFADLLQRAMTTAIQDEDSAAAVVPLDVTLPLEEIEAWRHMVFERPYDDSIDAKMERAIKRVALALDIWPELLLGIADVNHWNAWFLAEDTWQGHIAPLAEQTAGALEVAAGDVGIEVSITADPSELLARRSSVRDALDAAKLGAVSLGFVRDAIGANEDDIPTEEDLDIIQRMLGHAEEEPTVDENPGPPDTQEESQEEPIAAAAGDATSGLGVEMARIDDQLRAWLEGAAEVTVMLARSRVGASLRPKVKRDPKTRAMLDGVDNSEVVHVVGQNTAAETLDLPRTIRATVEPLAARWTTKLERAESRIVDLVGEVVDPLQWELARKRSAEMLVDDLSQFIEATLQRTDAEMPSIDLYRVVEAAGV